MQSQEKISEKQFHKIWATQDFTEELKTLSGEEITVLFPGDYNIDESGPDFKHARIKLGNLTFIGDVEIDQDYSDWKRHGHNINRNYNKTILHICFSNPQKQNYVYTSDGRKVPSLTIENYISADNIVDYQKINKHNVENNFELKCSSEINSVDKKLLENTLLNYGIKRFESKCSNIFSRLKELKFISELKLNEPVIRYELTKDFNNKTFLQSDFRDKEIWKQLLYEFIFEALGYSKNKKIMQRLAQNVNLKFLSQINFEDNFSKKVEAILFKVSGLLPEINNSSENEFIKDLHIIWQNEKQNYDGKYFDETQWHFLGQRPQNFPTIRIAGGVKIIEAILHHNFIGQIIRKFTEIKKDTILINSIRSLLIIKANGYWRDHYVFEKETNIKLNYLIGLSRADEIFVNVILPFLSVYFDLFGNQNLSKKVLKIYNEYDQKIDNKIIRDVSKALQINGLEKKTIYAQGMIEIFRNYCSKNKCLECEIGKTIFN
ncbi:MAG: DUF2851 family protein [Ignavibacteriae bacterium]|nr:DUF2851 family protein [Ignavibacteriota bacterium]